MEHEIKKATKCGAMAMAGGFMIETKGEQHQLKE